MEYFLTACRIAVGLNFFIFGLNGFFNFYKIPESKPAMTRFIESLFATGYIMTVVKVLEIICGACILANLFVPLTLVILAPLVFVIVTSQLILNRGQGLLITTITAVPYLVLVWSNREAYAPLLTM